MSDIGISIERVIEVLLRDGWYSVTNGSFFIGSRSFYEGEQKLPINDDDADWFSFENGLGEWLLGPLSSVLAIKHADPST